METSTPIVIGLGELLWDVFPDGRRSGGAPANVAFQANQLGCTGIIASRVGADAAGDDLLQALQAVGLETRYVQRDAAHSTGAVTVTLTPEGQPSYVIHEDVAWDHLAPQPDLLELAGRSAAICFGTLAQRTPVSRHAIHATLDAAADGCLIVYDVNLRQDYYDRDWVADSLAKSHIIKLNDEEVRVLAPLLDLPTGEREFADGLLDRWPCRMVCVTRGGRGCLLVDRQAAHEIPGRTIKVVDTVGAGDAFTAALIASQLRRWPTALGGEFANRVGALVAGRAGGMPELRRELSQLISQYQPE